MTDDDKVIQLNPLTPEDREAIKVQDEIYEEFGDVGLFTMNIVASIFGEVSERIDRIEEKLDKLLK